ncbi:UDP-N-acetyl-D-mannosamine dehydrogenase [Peteryoungia algae]|uniref:UDP-N-acetyl-D-mannosamine dehydrogenase n=1 Tax=Peteryoungia algae TaxID=2919917 RepID=A0ABT0CZU7_9HYPH|nr:UDP-N-acetyl-D-mannosamine dehydrogenase [Rhizobium sp. SSM4.3]MCJ8238689.1 UDP-N-acetyl-D-mannosamine dehydrogenase [Rhizobium sp. SSM4.3]
MSFPKLKVSVIGLGYIGLPTAAVLASVGHEVVGVDVNADVVELINRGQIHIVETDLAGLVQGVVSEGRLRASATAQPSDVFVIAVPTPFKDGNEPDLRFVEQASRSIADVLRPGSLIILESTSPVGTTEKMAAWLSELRPDLAFPHESCAQPDVNVAYCPERVLPGSIITELVKNDRVIGGMTLECSSKARRFYETFVRGECFVTDSRTAEMTKLTENAFRDVNIGFANELSLICDQIGINVWELIRLANKHPRVSILNPGPGVGGHCIAVDPWFIVHSAPDVARLIRTAREVNDGKPLWVVDKVMKAVSDRLLVAERAKVACLGLSFKANVDDLRESPALEIVEALAGQGAAIDIMVVEPFIEHLPATLEGKAALAQFEQAVAEADIVVLLVDHRAFKTIDPSLLLGKVVVDTRGFWQ